MTIGQQIRQLRTEQDLSVEYLAGIADVSIQMLYFIENGRDPSLKVLERIAKALRCDLTIKLEPKHETAKPASNSGSPIRGKIRSTKTRPDASGD